MTTAAASARTVVRETEPGAEWDAFVRSRPDATFCHLSGWAHVLSTTLGARPHYLEVRDADGAITGVLPLLRVKSPVGDHLVSMPFLNYGGSLGDDDARGELANAALELMRELGTDSLELRSRDREQSRLSATNRKITVMLDLPETDDGLWKAFPAKLRSQVRRPQKEGMTYAEGPEQIDDFYRVFAVNMRDLGTPVLPKRFFEATLRAFPDSVSFFVVRSGDVPVAGGCGFHHGGEFEITWASSLREFNRFSPNMLLYWESMRSAIGRGARRYNFGRCTPGGGTHRFKLQWGGADVPLGWSCWPSDDGGVPTSERPTFRLATQAWQRMPLWATNRIGPVVSRWFP